MCDFLTPRPPGRDNEKLPMKRYLTALFLSGLLFSPAASAQELGRAHIPYPIPDGTPPPPAPPKPTWTVPQQDVLSAKAYAEGGRTITVREIKPIPLPEPPPPREPSAPVQLSEEMQEKMAEFREKYAEYQLLFLGATMYRMEDGSVRSHVRIDGMKNREPIVFWSSADFSLLSGIGTITDKEGYQRAIMMSWGFRDIKNEARIAARAAAAGYEYHPAVVPELASGPASYLIEQGKPDEEATLIIDSLHEILNHDEAELKRAFAGRERARKEREAYLKANPPQPRNIVINHWRVERENKEQEGGNK